MSTDTKTPTPSPEDLARLRRQLSDRAVKLAVANRWDDALTVNREYVRLFPNDSDGYNRLGKSLAETGSVPAARDAYNRALELDPTNAIARRNLDRLRTIVATGSQTTQSKVDTTLFVSETGKTAVALLQAADREVVTSLDAGDVLELSLSGNAVNVLASDGRYVGIVEPRIGLRLARLMRGGNTYTAALLTTDGDIRVIVRETYQHPSQTETVSFPQSKPSDFRPYVSSGALRRMDRMSAIETDEENEDGEPGGFSDEEESWEDDPRGMRLVSTQDIDEDYD